jgi:ATP-dependent exoDNAse (exonuclease V) beta subunit
LYPFLEAVPALAVYSLDGPLSVDRPGHDLARLAQDRAAFWETAKHASYEITTVTTDLPETFAPRSGVKRGAAFGVVLHKLFEESIHKRLKEIPMPYIAHLLTEAGGSEEFIPDILEALKAFRSSEIWRELEAATAVYTEVPFAVSEPNTVTRGVIDLVYKVADAWHMVDYKTDAVVTDDEVAGLVSQVSNQINTYAHYWESLTGESVETKRLWLTERQMGVAV